MPARGDLDVKILIQYFKNRPDFFFSILRLTTLHGGSLDYTTRGQGNLLTQEVINLSHLRDISTWFCPTTDCTDSPFPSWTSWTARVQLVRLFINLELILMTAKKTLRYVNLLRVWFLINLYVLKGWQRQKELTDWNKEGTQRQLGLPRGWGWRLQGQSPPPMI